MAPSQGEVRLPYLFQTILRWVVTGSSRFEEAPGMVFVPTSLGARADLVGYPCRPHGIFVRTYVAKDIPRDIIRSLIIFKQYFVGLPTLLAYYFRLETLQATFSCDSHGG